MTPLLRHASPDLELNLFFLLMGHFPMSGCCPLLFKIHMAYRLKHLLIIALANWMKMDFEIGHENLERKTSVIRIFSFHHSLTHVSQVFFNIQNQIYKETGEYSTAVLHGQWLGLIRVRYKLGLSQNNNYFVRKDLITK